MARLPETRPSLARHLRYQQRQVRRLGTTSPFTRSGATVTGDSVTEVDGQWQSSDFDGDLNNGNAGTKGWAMNAIAAAFGALFLRPGSISNDALTNPVSGGSTKISASGFGLTTSFVELAYANLVVPSGFTQLNVTVGAHLFSYDNQTTGGSNGAGGDALYCMVAVGGSQSDYYPTGVSGNGGFATASTDNAVTLTGLTAGSAVRFSLYGASAYQTLASNSSNRASASASLFWLR